MLYRNSKTGAVIDVNSIMGGSWEPVEAPGAHAAENSAGAKPQKAETAKRSTSAKAVKKDGVRKPE